MRNPLALLIGVALCLPLTSCRSLTQPQETRQRALILTQAIEQDFWDPDKKAYLEVSPRSIARVEPPLPAVELSP